MRVLSREVTPEDPSVVKFKQKFSLPLRPSDEVPDIPRNLDDLCDADLMESYREFVSWVSFAKAELVKAEIEEERETHQCKIIESKVLIEQWGTDTKSDRVTLAKARRDVNPVVVGQQEKLLKARAYRKLAEAMYDRCDRGAQLLSRELTRRVGSGHRDNRNARMSA